MASDQGLHYLTPLIKKKNRGIQGSTLLNTVSGYLQFLNEFSVFFFFFFFLLLHNNQNAVSILYKSIAGRYRPVSCPDGPITARYRFIKNAYWECSSFPILVVYGENVMVYLVLGNYYGIKINIFSISPQKHIL